MSSMRKVLLSGSVFLALLAKIGQGGQGKPYRLRDDALTDDYPEPTAALLDIESESDRRQRLQKALVDHRPPNFKQKVNFRPPNQKQRLRTPKRRG